MNNIRCANCDKEKSASNENEFTAFAPTGVKETIHLCGSCIVEISGEELMRTLDSKTAGEISIQRVTDWVRQKDLENSAERAAPQD